MSEWSENKRYKNPDITGLVDNVKRMMGVDSGAAGRRSRNMSDFLTTSKTEGQQLKNIGQQHKNVKFKALADVIQRLMLDPSLSDKDQYSMFSGTGSGDIETGYTKSALRPSVVRKSEAEAGVAEHDLGKEQAIKMIRERLMNYQPPEPELGGDRADADWVRSARSARQGAGRELNERDAQLYNLLTGVQMKTGADPTGKYTKAEHEKKIEKEGKIIDFYQAKIDGFKELNGKKVTEVLKRTDKIIAEMDIAKDIGHERVNQIRQAVLDDVNLNIENIQNLKDQNKLIQERIKTETKKLEKEGHLASKAKKIDEATDNELSFKLERLRQLKRKETSLAEKAATDASFAKELNTLRVDIAKLNKEIKGIEKGTAGIKKDTATAQKDKAVDLADMSELELNALPKKIKAQAQEMTNKNLKLEEQIKLVKAQTDDKRRASGLKILQKSLLNNKLAIQKLLSPYIQDLAKAKAKNEAEKFTQQTKNIMLRDQLKKKTGTETIELNPDTSLFDPSTWFNSLGKVNKEVYADISASMFEHKDKIKSGTLPPKIKDSIIADIIKSLQVDPQKAQKIYDYTISTF